MSAENKVTELIKNYQTVVVENAYLKEQLAAMTKLCKQQHEALSTLMIERGSVYEKALAAFEEFNK
jgi:hypothetical protein